jgi:tagatose-6-phosphate ketose/aldose isomerase
MSDTPLTRLAAEDDETRKTNGTLHTPGEILQQPWLWRDTAGRASALAEKAANLFKGADFALFAGAGSSLHAGRMIEDAARNRFGASVGTVSCTDLMLSPDAYVPKGRRGVLFSLSRSGESPEAVEAARIVAERFPDVAHVAITCNSNGKLAKLVEGHPKGLCLVLHEKSYDRGIGTTSSMTCTVVAGRVLADPSSATRVDGLAKAGEEILAQAERAERAAARKPERVVVLGTGPLEAAAQEGAHKILELTDGQVASMARSYLEFRHGPISFLNEKTLLLSLVSPDPLIRRYEMDFIGGTSGMGVQTAETVDSSSLSAGEAAIVGTVYAQMLALFVSLHRGLKPDRPGGRGLVNPIVKGVTIYPRKETP